MAGLTLVPGAVLKQHGFLDANDKLHIDERMRWRQAKLLRRGEEPLPLIKTSAAKRGQGR